MNRFCDILKITSYWLGNDKAISTPLACLFALHDQASKNSMLLFCSVEN